MNIKFKSDSPLKEIEKLDKKLDKTTKFVDNMTKNKFQDDIEQDQLT